MGGGDFRLQGADGILHGSGGDNALAVGPDAVRIAPGDTGRRIEITLLQGLCRGFDGIEDGTVRAVAAFLPEKFDELVESALGVGGGGEETVEGKAAVFLEAGLVEQAELAAEAEFKGKGTDDAAEKSIHRAHGQTRQRGGEVSEPLSALVGSEIGITDFLAEFGKFGGVAGRISQPPEKFLQKFGGSFAGEGESKDAVRRFTAGDEFETARDEAVGFTAAGIGHDEEDAGEIFHGRPPRWAMVVWSNTLPGSSPPNQTSKLS